VKGSAAQAAAEAGVESGHGKGQQRASAGLCRRWNRGGLFDPRDLPAQIGKSLPDHRNACAHGA
jgi:hypothetical protein